MTPGPDSVQGSHETRSLAAREPDFIFRRGGVAVVEYPKTTREEVDASVILRTFDANCRGHFVPASRTQPGLAARGQKKSQQTDRGHCRAQWAARRCTRVLGGCHIASITPRARPTERATQGHRRGR